MHSRARTLTLVGGLLVLLLVPVVAALADQPFYLDLFRRIMIFAIAAVSLDLILGFGGMVSFGHAAYLGIGAYAVAIPAFYGITSGFVQWTLALLLAGLIALAIGAVSLRTSGVSFIMITLAFAQMLYYLGISINAWGADDGMRLARRSEFGVVNLANGYVFYYVVLGLLVVLLGLGHRLVNARFGVVIRAAKSNEPRMRAIGFSTFRYKLAAFAIAGAVGGLAGALLTNQTEYLTLGRDHGDGHPGRHGHAVRSGAGRLRVSAARRRAVGVDGALADRAGAAPRPRGALRASRSLRPAARARWLSRC
jgi:branched-chain amino acid transport system permease protein